MPKLKYIFDPLALTPGELQRLRESPDTPKPTALPKPVGKLSNREAIVQIQVELGAVKAGIRKVLTLADETGCLTNLEREHIQMLDDQRAFVQQLVREALFEAYRT